MLRTTDKCLEVIPLEESFMTFQNSVLIEEGFVRKDWACKELGNVVVFHNEVFRMNWFATKLVTFVFIINGTPTDYAQIESNYDFLSAYARSNKNSIIPRGLNLGYALLPIYCGTNFDESLIRDVKSKYLKKWCMFHIPSLFDMDDQHLITMEAKMIWGRIYQSFIQETIQKSASAGGPCAAV